MLRATHRSQRARSHSRRGWIATSLLLAAGLAAATISGPVTASAARSGNKANLPASLQAAVRNAVKHAATNSIDPYGPEGMNVYAAQSTISAGATKAGFTPHVVVAYIEAGIDWFDSSAQALANSVYVNWHDTPVPCVGASVATATMTLDGKTVPCATAYSNDRADYDTDGVPGVVTVQDWAQDPRVNQNANGAGYLNPEDLIAAFSGPGYIPPHLVPAGYDDAISGWDFYDNQNDPATTDAAYGHSDDQMNVIHTICPTCLILPVKAGDEAIDSTEDLAKAWLFAAQSGAKVIVSVTADLGYSSFAKQVLAYLNHKGVIVVEASNDFDSTDHQGGMYWNNVIPGDGLVANTNGVSGSTLSAMAGPFWTRSDYTSWGVHAMFSVATGGGTTSESTPTTGAVLALVLTEAAEAASLHEIDGPMSGPQAVQVLRTASTEPTAPSGSSLTWPSGPGNWNEQYGYGMPDVETAVEDVAAGDVPAGPEIDSPDWYSIDDPTTTKSVTVKGTVSAYPNQSYTWDLEYNTGGDPQAWHTISSGIASGDFGGTFGTLKLAAIPKSFYEAPFSLSATKELTTTDQYDVTFRVVTAVRGHANLVGLARRVIDVFHDATAISGFPTNIGSSGESQPALIDLQGTGNLDVVFGTADGTIDAINPKTGLELPGWPAHTNAVTDANLPSGVSAGYQPIVSDVAVGDLFHTGQLAVVATSYDGYVYVFDSHGQLKKGWPQQLNGGVTSPAIPRPALPNQRLPHQGASAPPVLAALQSNSPDLDIVQAGWDGEIHAWTGTGNSLKGWPMRVTLTSAEEDLPANYTLEDDQKLDTAPAVAYFSKTGPADLVIRSQYTELGPDIGGLQALPYAFVFAYTAGGELLPGWPVRIRGTIEDYGSAQEFITEGTDSPVAADVVGAAGGNLDQVAVGPVWSPDSLLTAAGRNIGTYGQPGEVLTALLNIVQHPSLAITGPLPGPTPTPFTGSGAFGIIGSQLVYAQPTIGAESLAASLLYSGSGNAIQELESVWPASAGTHSGGSGSEVAELPGFPTTEQGDAFLGAPIIAPVGSGAGNDVILGGDSSAVNAQLSTGVEAPGFPKFTGGWTTYAPSAGDLFGNGTDDLVTITREGYLFAWSTTAPAPATGSWWRALHDEYNSGNEGIDSRPPGIVRDARLSGTTLTVEAPGANWYDGQASSYQLIYVSSGGHLSAVQTVTARSVAGSTVTLTVPAGTKSVLVRAVNSGGLLSNAQDVTTAGQSTIAWP